MTRKLAAAALTLTVWTLMAYMNIGAEAIAKPAITAGRGPCSGWFARVVPDMDHDGVPATTTDRALVNHRMERLILCATRLWPVPGGYLEALRIAHRESGDPWIWPWAYNPSGCAGTYQHMLRYWAGRVADWWNDAWLWTTPSAFNPRANVIVTMRMVHAHGWGPWT